MRRQLSFVFLGLLIAAGSHAHAVSLNFSGHFRTEANLLRNGDLSGGTANKAWLGSRAILQPKFVIDDHFSLNSQWSLLASPTMAPNALTSAYSQGNAGYVMGDPTPSTMVLSRAWLEWISDFGVVRLGRMPVSWGYGLMYDSGNGMWDDFQTTFDRLEYRLHFGHVIGAIAYSKPFKTSVLNNDGDQDFYTIYVRYDNPEQDVEAGLMFERQVRSNTPAGNGPLTTGNPLNIPNTVNGTLPPLATRAPFPLSNNVIDFYAKKTMGDFTFGGELGWTWGTAFDYRGNNRDDDLSAFGLMLNATYEYHNMKAFVDFLYASGDADLNDRLNGFVLLNRNRRAGLILGRELLGNYYGNNVAQGGMTYYGSNQGFSGVYYVRPGFRFEWSPSWASGIEVIIAKKAAVVAGESNNLGVEIDIGTDHELYKNFALGFNLGYLFAGDGLGVPNPSGVFGMRATASVKF